MKAFLSRIPAAKLRSGAFAALLTVLVLLALILLCAAGDAAEKKYALQTDFSFNGATTQSAATREALSGIGRDVHIYIISSAGKADSTLLSLLNRYTALNAHITCSEESLASNPTLLTRFEGMLGSDPVTADCLIVHCAETGRARRITQDDFPVFDYETESGFYMVSGINYEKPLTEAIVYVAQDEPVTLQLLRGHQELSGDALEEISGFLTGANYCLKSLDLSSEEPDPAFPVLILCPQWDLTEKELSRLTAFADAGGDFLILSDYADPADLPNYSALLLDYGVRLLPGLVMADTEETDAYYDEFPAYLTPRYAQNTLTEPLLSGGKTRLLMPGSRALQLPEITHSALRVEPLVYSGRGYVRDYTASAPDSAEKQEGDPSGYFTLAVLSTRVKTNVSRAVIIGNSLMFTDVWIRNNTHSEDFLLRCLETLQGSLPVSLSIPAKPLREGLSLSSLTGAWILAFVPAALTLAAALVVLLRRKKL